MQQVQKQHLVMRFFWWLRDLLLSGSFQATEAQAAIIACLLGCVLLNPLSNTFANPGFAAMAGLAPEWVWGLALVWVGGADLVAMIKGSLRWRRATLFVISCLWAFLSVMFCLSSPNGWGVWLFGVLAISAGWAYWRMALRNR